MKIPDIVDLILDINNGNMKLPQKMHFNLNLKAKYVDFIGIFKLYHSFFLLYLSAHMKQTE